MSRIFISHSSRDTESIDFFNKIFSTLKVSAIYEEYDQQEGRHISNQKIKDDIESSCALFVLLDEQIEDLKHTRDWIAWETGVAKGLNKKVFVFEKTKDTGKLGIVIPHLDHFIVYDPNNYNWRNYLKPIIQSFDNTSTVTTVALSSAAGAALAEDKWTGGLIGLGIGLFLANGNKDKTFGESVQCFKCRLTYFIHVSPGQLFRCPSCNQMYQQRF
ncbi:hypothetical protein [Pukyongia salina]|nr:hypothetical protein [Pukyongia salina]